MSAPVDVRFNLGDALIALERQRQDAVDGIGREYARLVEQLQTAHAVAVDEIPTLENATAAVVVDVTTHEHQAHGGTIRRLGVIFDGGWCPGQAELRDPLPPGEWRVLVLVTPRPKVRT